MKVPLNWLKDYVDINVSAEEFAHEMTLSGSKVESVEIMGEDINKVVVGKILAIEKHTNADRLQVTKVDVGKEVIQVVTGAQNISVGDCVPVALVGATLPGNVKISKGKLRGVESFGMMCSIQELNLTKDEYPDAAEDGIFILDSDLEPGIDIKEVLGMNDTVVEFEITSNRPDCLSVLGIAREASATLKTKLKKPQISVKEQDDEAFKYASVEIKAPDLCPRYAARIVKDVKIGPSPKWMRERLKAAGVRPINNIVDITNYVMLELGQPMHAFDLKNIDGSKIVVRRAYDGEKITTLDGQDRALDSSMLVIADSNKPVAVAGVMGGANSEISPDTKTVLFESANFNGTAVRLAAKKLGMRTESSGRFEKGLDIENVLTAINRAAQLAEEIGAGTVCKGIIDCYEVKPEIRYIDFRPDKINKFLGTNIPETDMIEILESLEIEVVKDGRKLKIPSFRQDLEVEADIAEEIARFYGYNNIEPTLLTGKASTQGKKTYKQKIEDKIRNIMLSCGMFETYTYSFTSTKVFDKINLPQDSVLRKRAVVISNPLGEDYKIMRTTTIPDMLEVISRNYNRRVEEARLFEISYIYLKNEESDDKLPEERKVLTLGMYGNTDFYDLKGIVEELFDNLGIKNYDIMAEKDNPTFHPGRTASVSINGKNAGVFGEINPQVSENFEAPERTYIGIFDIQLLVQNSAVERKYKPLPKYPAVTRDIAMLVRDEITVKQIDQIIRQRGGKILEDAVLFDVYKGKQVPEGMKSIAYSITFRAEDRTLTDEDVNKAMQKIIDSLKNNLDAQLRE